MKYVKQNAGWCTPGVLDGHEGHTPKSCCPLYAAHSLSRGNMKNLMPRSFTFVYQYQLHCCSSKHNNNKALRITFNSCKTVSTSSMALATVNVDKIIKVMSASSYVLCVSIAIKLLSAVAIYSGFIIHGRSGACTTWAQVDFFIKIFRKTSALKTKSFTLTRIGLYLLHFTTETFGNVIALLLDAVCDSHRPIYRPIDFIFIPFHFIYSYCLCYSVVFYIFFHCIYSLAYITCFHKLQSMAINFARTTELAIGAELPNKKRARILMTAG